MVALMHAVQVMNFLKILISKILKERGGGSTQNEAFVESKEKDNEENIGIKSNFDQNVFEDQECCRRETAVQGRTPSLTTARPSINYRKKKSTHVKKLSLDVNKLPKRFNDNKHADFD